MLKTLKNKVFVGAFIMTLAVFGFLAINSSKAEAATCTATGSTDWNTTGTWDCGHVPTSASSDAVIIPSGDVVTMTASPAASVSSLTINNAGATTGLTMSGTSTTLTVTGAVTLAAPSVAGTTTLAVGNANLVAGSISVSGGAATFVSALTASTGAIITTGGLTFGGTPAQAQLTTTGAAFINLTGTMTGAGAVTINSGTTLTTTGTTALNTPATFGILTVSTGTTTTGAALTFAGNATVASGATLNLDTGAVTISGTTGVTGTLGFTSATGTKTFTGTVTINSGGTWTESAAVAVTYAANLANSGTFTASSGVHTFGTGAISGTVAIPSLTGTAITNNGTLTVSTTLAGTALTNTGNLSIGGTSGITTLTATAIGNVVNYTGTAQTLKATSYYNLNINGSAGTDTAGVLTIAGDLSVSSGKILALTGDSTAGFMNLAGSHVLAGIYGATSTAGITIANDTYFSGTAGKITVASRHGSGSTTTTTTNVSDNSTTVTTTTTPVVTPPAAPVTIIIDGCGNSNTGFSITTGQSCATNTVVPIPAPVVIAGCAGNTGFSVTTGQSCVGNSIVTPTAPAMPQLMLSANVKATSGKTSIMTLQTALNVALGSTITPLVVDGIWGAKTTAAVKKFQAWAHITVDGQVGPITRGKLNAAVGAY